MDDVTYISGDVHVSIPEQEPVRVNVDDITAVYGGLPRSGIENDILVKQSDRDFDAGWVSASDLGFSKVYSDTKQHWNSQLGLISEKNAIYVYTDYATVDGNQVPAIKIGDGLAYVVDLPFVSDDIRSLILLHISDPVPHVSAEERTSWNNGVTAYMSNLDPENLILAKNGGT